MNASHQLGKLKNRLARLKRQEKIAPSDRKMMMTARIKEIEETLREHKKK